jgi:hypothetical protein
MIILLKYMCVWPQSAFEPLYVKGFMCVCGLKWWLYKPTTTYNDATMKKREIYF